MQKIEDKTLKVKEAQQRENQMRMVQESEKALLNGLTSEKRHLELSLKENMEVKDQYKEKCEELQKKYETLFKDAQSYKR